jgi:serine/threonine protein kinase/Tol biopolymer transport system component
VDADRWNQVGDCYHSALERPPHERAAFLAQACANDPELRREVESLLGHEGQADGLLESPAWDHLAPPDETITIAPGALAAGALMAEYRIVGKLGSGGMGEVYRATDTRLQREVALKVLTPAFAHDSEWLSRFQREARVLASLNHPHIAAVYGLEESGGVRAIAMELVEGPTLADRLAKGRIPIPEALTIAKQIVEALEYAHEKGIVHRDLKPANVKLRPDGVVKVLDFGLAKTVVAHETPSTTATGAGVILGTPAYMAPEQAAGLPVDRRADIWAFGIVLFEMLTGHQIYARKTTLETLAAVARDEPRWDLLPAETPATILRLLRRCLDKDSKRRLRDIGEARIALEEDRPEETAGSSSPARRWRARAGWIAAVALLGLAAAAGWIAFFRAGSGVPAADWRLSVVPPPGTELPSVGSYHQATPEISPDGTMIVCRLGEGLQLRKLNSTQFIPLGGTKDAVEPFWSPDSQWIGFNVKGSLMKMQVPDGAPEPLWRSLGGGGTWGSTGTILAGSDGELLAIPAAGGSATTLPTPKPLTGFFYPHFLPDGEHFLFFGGPEPVEGGTWTSNLYLGGWSSGKWTLMPVPLKANCGEARYSPAHGGAVLFVQNDNLYAQKLNLGQARLEGSATLVEASVASMGGLYPDTASFSVSGNGVLAWRPGRPYAEQLTWFDRHGGPVGTAGPPSWYLVVRPSPDERRIAAVVAAPGGTELRVLETAQSSFLTILKPGATFNPSAVIWRRDSLHLLYTTPDSVEYLLLERSATGGSEVRQLGKVPAMSLQDIAPDGTMLGMIHNTLHVVPSEGDRTPRPLLASEEPTRQGAFSPDGRWVVYASAPAQELFVQAFPISGPRRQISAGGGTMPYWRGDGKEILYLGPDKYLYSVRSDPARGEFQPGERLFAVHVALNSPNHFTLAATRDGSRILFNQAIDEPESRVIAVALHR